MKFKILLVILVVSVFTLNAQNQESTDSFKRVKINNVDQATLDKLAKNGLDLECGAILTDSNLTIELVGSELNVLDNLGIPYNVEIEDLTKFYSERATADAPKAAREFKAAREKSKKLKAKGVKSKSISELLNNVGQYTGENEIDWVQPVNWNLNPNIINETNLSSSSNITPHFGGCLTYDQVLQELHDMKTYCENNGIDIISDTLDASPTHQKTLEGRTVYYVRISDNPDIDDKNKPETLYQSLIHSREAATVMNQLYFMWYLLENYNSDQAIRNLVNNQELYFIPVFNPDGFVYNQTIAPNGGGGQRKNRNTSAGSCGTYDYGIDLNRNSAYYWNNGGSSSDACNQTYMGVGPFSENETQIMRDFFVKHDFQIALNHHSYKNAYLHGYAGVDQAYPVLDAGSDNSSSNDNDTSNDYSIADMYSKYNYDMTYYNRYMHGPSTQVTSLNSGNMNDWMLGGVEDTNARGVSTPTSYPFPSPNDGSGKHTLSWTPENGLYSEGTGGPGGSYSGFWPAPSKYDDIARRAMRPNFMAAYFSGKYAKLHDMTPSNITADGNLTFGLENLGRTASDFTITVTATSGLATVGTAVTETGMHVLEQRYVNIPFTLSAGIQANDKIEYKVTLTNDYATDNVLYEATIVKYYQPTELKIDDPDSDNLTNWTGSGWSTTNDAFSGTTAISRGTYSGSATNRIQLISNYDFTNGSEFLIQYYAKWDLERSFDYVQIEASTDGSSWTPLNGKYTKPGAPNDNNNYSNKSTTSDNFQPDYEPLYDGDTAGKWVMEEITVDPSNNSIFFNEDKVYIRFEFKSDSNNRKDSYINADFEGFQFDDFKIIKIQEPCVLSVPTNVVSSAETAAGATISWDYIPSATYDLQYRETGTSTWSAISDLNTTSYDLSGLSVSTEYEVQVRSKCSASSVSAYTTSYKFSTTAIEYCDAYSSNSFYFGITNVSFNTINNSDVTKDSGYEDFSSISTNVERDENYVLSVSVSTRANNNHNYYVYAKAWIDFNNDGDFKDANETYDLGYLYDNREGSVTSISPTITIPSNATIAPVKMRIIAKYNADPTSCEENFDYGEVEDYTVNIIDSTLGIQDEILSTFNLYPNPSNIGEIRLTVPSEIQEFNVEISNLLGQKIVSTKKVNGANKIHTINTSAFKTGVYFVSVTTDLGRATKKMIIE